jgi:hypothetical protein
MLVRQIKPVDVENRLFRGEVLDKVEVSTQVQRVLLQDCKGDCIYVIMQGARWYQRGKALRRGDKVQLGPFKPKQVPHEFASFFAPKTAAGYVADLYIEFAPDDFEYGIVIDSPETASYTSLSQCIEAACEQVPGRFNIAGIIIDYVQDDKGNQTMVKCKLTDESLEPGEFLQVLMFIKNSSTLPRVSSAGDVIALHGLKLTTYQGRPQAIYDSHSSAFGVFGLETIERISGQLPLFKETEAKLSRLVDWGVGALQTRSVLTGRPLKNLGSLKSTYLETVDCVCFVFKLLEGYPEEGSSTIFLCDSTGCALLEAPVCQISHVKENTWVKLRDVKAFTSYFKTTRHTSLLAVPEYCRDVQEHINATLPGLTAMQAQALALYESMHTNCEMMQTRLVTYTTLQGAPLLTLPEVVNPCVTREFCRFKCLLVDFQPRSLAAWLDRPPVGLMSVWAASETIEVVVTARSATDLFSLESTTPEAAEAKLKRLMSGSNWLELGLRRVIWKGQVMLELYKTFTL